MLDSKDQINKKGMVRLLYGEDGFRVRERLRFYTDAFGRQYDPQGLSIARFYPDGKTGFSNGAGAPGSEIADLHRSLNTPPLFATKRLFIIYNFSKIKLDKGKEEIVLNDIKNLKDNSIIFIEEISEKDFKGVGFYKKIKLDSGEYFPYLKGGELLREVQNKFEKNGVRIEPQALDRFLCLVGSDFWKINSEMEKLIAFLSLPHLASPSPREGEDGGGGKIIHLKDVETTVLPEAADNCFALIDCLSRKDKKNIFKEVEYLKKSGISPETIFYQIGSHFRQILEAKALSENKKIGFNAIAEVFHLHPYRAQKIHQAAANFTIEELKKIHNLILETDLKIKTGKLKPDISMDLLITNLTVI